jgi:hypothetical protein
MWHPNTHFIYEIGTGRKHILMNRRNSTYPNTSFEILYRSVILFVIFIIWFNQRELIRNIITVFDILIFKYFNITTKTITRALH